MSKRTGSKKSRKSKIGGKMKKLSNRDIVIITEGGEKVTTKLANVLSPSEISLMARFAIFNPGGLQKTEETNTGLSKEPFSNKKVSKTKSFINNK